MKKERKRRKADGRSRLRRENVVRPTGGEGLEGDVGAKRSESVPVRRRARVEVKAMIVICVDGRPAGGEE